MVNKIIVPVLPIASSAMDYEYGSKSTFLLFIRIIPFITAIFVVLMIQYVKFAIPMCALYLLLIVCDCFVENIGFPSLYEFLFELLECFFYFRRKLMWKEHSLFTQGENVTF